MTFLAPWALWFSLIGLAVIALYLLKIKRRRQVVPAFDLWLELVYRTQVRSLLQRMKRFLSLLLWLVIVAALVLSSGNPLITWGKVQPEAIAVIVDNSASMQTVEKDEQGQTRFELAANAVKDLIGRRPVNDEWMLIEAGRDPHVLQGLTRDRRAIERAVTGITPRVGSGNLAAAVDLARQLLDGKPRRRIVIVSDGASGQLAEISRDDPDIVHWPIGSAHENLGITQLSVRAHRQQSAHYAYLKIVNAGAEEVETDVAFEVDGNLVKVEPVKVSAGGSWEKTLVFEVPDGGVLRASISRPDDLAADNDAFAVLEPIESVSVMLVARPEEAYFFQEALLAMESLVDGESSRTYSPAEYEKLDSSSRSADLTIFNGYVPQQSPGPGQFIYVNCRPQDLPVNELGQLENPALTITNTDHPLTRYLNLGAVHLARAAHWELIEAATVLAESADEAPLIFLSRSPDAARLCLAFDVLESDLPFRNAFPILLRNAVSFLVADRTNWIRPQYHVDDVIRPARPLPEDISQVTVARYANESADKVSESDDTVEIQEQTFAYRETGKPGPLRFSLGEDVAYTTINLTDETESQIKPVAGGTDPGEQLALTQRMAGVVPWLALAMLATALVSLEWLTYHFRWTE